MDDKFEWSSPLKIDSGFDLSLLEGEVLTLNDEDVEYFFNKRREKHDIS